MIKHNLFILFFLLIITVNVSAKENNIDYVYMNANMDILGSFHIREAIVTRDDEVTIPIVYKPYTKKQTKDNLENTTFYNGRGASIKCAKSFNITEKEIDFNLLDKNCTKGEKTYTSKKDNDKINISIKGDKKSTYKVYIIDYFIDQISVLHNDTAEINFPFISNYNYNIKTLSMQVVLSGYSKNFKFWSHSSGNGNLSAVGEKKKGTTYYKGIILKIKNVDKNSDVRIRMLFDKKILNQVKKVLNNSNKDMYKKITNLEDMEQANTKKSKKLNSIKGIFIKIISIIYIIGLFGLIYYFVNKRFDLLIFVFYIILGLIVTILGFILI